MPKCVISKLVKTEGKTNILKADTCIILTLGENCSKNKFLFRNDNGQNKVGCYFSCVKENDLSP
jgi:hypothetical protein